MVTLTAVLCLMSRGILLRVNVEARYDEGVMQQKTNEIIGKIRLSDMKDR